MNITFSTPVKLADSSADSHSCVYVFEQEAPFYGVVSMLCEEKGLLLRSISRLADITYDLPRRTASCLLMDAECLSRGGPQTTSTMRQEMMRLPVILMAKRPSVKEAVEAIRLGAIDYLQVPILASTLSAAIDLALTRATDHHISQQSTSRLLQHFRSLTPREHQVLALVAAGCMNKQVASDLGVSEITVKIHRANVMKKMGAKTLADLVRMAEKLYACSSFAKNDECFSTTTQAYGFLGSEDPTTPNYSSLQFALCQPPSGSVSKAPLPPLSRPLVRA